MCYFCTWLGIIHFKQTIFSKISKILKLMFTLLKQRSTQIYYTLELRVKCQISYRWNWILIWNFDCVWDKSKGTVLSQSGRFKEAEIDDSIETKWTSSAWRRTAKFDGLKYSKWAGRSIWPKTVHFGPTVYVHATVHIDPFEPSTLDPVLSSSKFGSWNFITPQKYLQSLIGL